MPKITPFLTFDGRVAEAIELYCSLFKNSKIHYKSMGARRPGTRGQLD